MGRFVDNLGIEHFSRWHSTIWSSFIITRLFFHKVVHNLFFSVSVWSFDDVINLQIFSHSPIMPDRKLRSTEYWIFSCEISPFDAPLWKHLFYLSILEVIPFDFDLVLLILLFTLRIAHEVVICLVFQGWEK